MPRRETSSHDWECILLPNIPYTACYREPRLKYHLRFSLGLIPKAYHVITQSYLLPIRYFKEQFNHPHAHHYLNEVYCMDCHQGVAHGRIDERHQTIDGDFAKWTIDFATQEMIPGNLQIGMKECMECHQNRGIGPLQCVGYHEKMITPDSHKDKRWGQFMTRTLDRLLIGGRDKGNG